MRECLYKKMIRHYDRYLTKHDIKDFTKYMRYKKILNADLSEWVAIVALLLVIFSPIIGYIVFLIQGGN